MSGESTIQFLLERVLENRHGAKVPVEVTTVDDGSVRATATFPDGKTLSATRKLSHGKEGADLRFLLEGLDYSKLIELDTHSAGSMESKGPR